MPILPIVLFTAPLLSPPPGDPEPETAGAVPLSSLLAADDVTAKLSGASTWTGRG